MAITLKVTGNGTFAGAETNIAGYSASEDATPINPADSSGGTGQTTFNVVEDSASDGSIMLLGDTIELEDDFNGRTQGVVTSVAGNNGALTMTVSSRLNAFVVDCTIPSYSGTLDGAFRVYCALAGFTTGIVVDSSIGSRNVTFPALTGNLWDNIKKLCAAQQVEVSLVSSNIVLRPLRGRVLETVTNSSESWDAVVGDTAQTIEIYYYGNAYRGNSMVYPESNEDTGSSIQVGTSEVMVVSYPVSASLSGIQQPTAVASVPKYYEGADSVYSVVDSEGKAVSPGVWTGAGGRVTAAISADYTSIEVTIIGPDIVENSPFRLEGGVDGATYSTLRVMGSGVFSDPQLLTLPTGAPVATTPQIVGITVQNPFISTLAEAYTAGLITAGRYSGADQAISISATIVNRVDEPGSINYPTFAEFNAEWNGKTFAQFNTAQSGKTFGDFSATYLAAVADTFANQVFGNLSGARTRFRAAYYRIRGGSITHDTISYSGERDTLFSDFNTVWSGRTFGDFNTRMTGKTFADYGVIPLWQ